MVRSNTQALVFETDELPVFEEMLGLATRILFHFGDGPNPKILLREPHFWSDGRYDEGNFDPDPAFVYPHAGGQSLVLEPCATFAGATELRCISEHKTREEAARVVCDMRAKPKPTRMWIATLYQNAYDAKPHERYSCQGWNDLKARSILACQQADKRRFRSDFEHAELPYFDGSIDCGYRMESGYESGMDVLHISMVHIYYGK